MPVHAGVLGKGGPDNGERNNDISGRRKDQSADTTSSQRVDVATIPQSGIQTLDEGGNKYLGTSVTVGAGTR